MFESSLKRVAAALVVALFALFSPGPADCREIVDMAGRTVSIPDTVKKVYGGSPPATYMIYALAPELLVGLNYPFSPVERRFLKESVRGLPVVGGWFGQGRTPNREALLHVKPDVMVAWMWKKGATNEKVEEIAEELNLPVVYVRLDRLGDYSEAFRFMGRLLGREARAETLSAYASRVLAAIEPAVAAIPEEKRVSVYYAEAPDGLSTECDKSPHTELIELAGGKNAYRCEPKNDFGMERISIEQVMRFDPEVILAQEKEFVDGVYGDPKWRSIRAVKNKRVHLIPKAPFNWFDRPPSFMRLLGVKWVANIFYPERIPFDSAGETREFYGLFLGLELDDEALREVMRQ